MTLKVTGHQWYWRYTYPDHGDFSFDSIPIPTEELQPGQPRLLAVDNPVVVPVGATVQVLISSDDVIHNWAVPSLRPEEGRDSGPSQRDVVPRDPGGHLLRDVLGAVRRQSLLHADRGARRLARRRSMPGSRRQSRSLRSTAIRR